MRLKLSLRSTWTLLVLFAVIVPAFVMMFWFGYQLYTTQLNNALQIEQQANDALRDRIESELTRLTTIFHNKADPLESLVAKIDNPGTLNEINLYINIIIERESAIQEIIILSKNADTIAAIDPNIGLTTKQLLSTEQLQTIKQHWGIDDSNQLPEFVIPLQGRNYISSPKIHDGFMGFIIAIPIGSPTQAVMISLIEIEQLWTKKEQRKYGAGSDLTRGYLLDRRGALLTAPVETRYKPGDLMTHFAITRSALVNAPWQSAQPYIGINGQRVFGTITTIPSLNWSLISEVDTSHITQSIWNKLISIFTFMVFALGIFIWIILHLAKKTIEPIQAVCEASNQVAQGDYDISLQPCGIRELDTLALDFNFMAYSNEKNQQALINEKALAEQANQAKSDFLSSMSHELRTPMNAILGFAQLLALNEKSKLSKDQKENISYILSSGQHLMSLINDVLELASIETGKTELSITTVKISDVVNDSLPLLKHLANKANIKISLLSDSALTVKADYTKLKQIMVNLLSNAIKYNRDGGKVSIDWQMTQTNNVRIRVVDNGIGIKKSNLDKIFDAFNRLGQENSNIEGTGIGLVITKDLIEMMDGHIDVESVENEGTTFSFELPHSSEPLKEEEPIVKVNTNDIIHTTRSNQVLYVEDNPVNRLFMSAFFKNHENYNLQIVESGESGWEIASNEDFDLILMDIHLPGINGKELTQKLRATEQYKKIPIIAVSAATSSHEIESSKDLFNDYLTKPIQISELDDTLKKYLN